ncbi:MAG: cell wall-binding repeat-containing protein [Acidimicrobiales bacterium]|nr:cell wall-binding repeat-containing protein [Acidimicrobiales bacterium]MYD83221.1 cell wall-binding repeat-containing protein [Acidimicrobiales bacterium]MYJ66203.1 cell wall-binding repeat-containing protein [Acidimicrobiales bacterium]
MTTTKMRRGKRSLAAILAAMLMASVLAVVAGSPAHAANTSSEALVDTNSDGKPDAREFGGRDRYDTANRLAENFGKAEGLGNVPVAFVASGHMQVDAISVAGLAGFLDAPVLLTPSDSLNGSVADFIEDYGVQTVHVLGGPAAVADSVVEAIEGLANKPTVSRIAGDDRYATAAAVASRLGGAAAWCGGTDAAAILANGGDVSLAYAMAISPIANRLQLPLLLTAADELPSATEDFITDEDIEHVVIVGGESSVSDDVSAALTTAGVNTVTRISGDTPAAVSAELATLAGKGCKADLGLVSSDTVALVAESGLPDGVAASPVLASSYKNGDLVPLLIVGDTLPASVSDYLAATPALDGNNKLHLNIVAIGGTAAVSEKVMQDALAAAASADALTVQITSDTNVEGSTTEWKPPMIGDEMVVLRFSDNIVDDDPDATPATTDLTNLIRDNLEVNGVPARLAANSAISRDDGTGGDCAPDTVTVTLASALKAGDVVSLTGGAKFGAAKDQRTVAGASVTVPAAPRDTTAPSVTVVAIDATSTTSGIVDVALVRFDDMDLDTTNDNNTVDTDEIRITTKAGSTTAKVPSDPLKLADGDKITVANADGDTVALEAGDRVTILSGALVDKAGNKSRARTFTVLAAPKSPRITSVTMSDMVHATQATVDVPEDLTEASPDNNSDNNIKITAKKGGSADGAAGNGWTIRFDRVTSWKADATAAVDIDVRVSSKDRVVSVRFNTGNAKFADLKSALEANSAFDAMFKVTLPAAKSGVCGATANNPVMIATVDRGETAPTAGGKTAVAVVVTFGAYAYSIDADGELGNDVFAEVVKRHNAVAADLDISGGTVSAIDTAALTRLHAALINDPAGNPTGSVTAGTAVADVSGPANMARYELETGNPLLLPKVRDLVTTAAGTPDSVTGTDARDPVATGYAMDDTATDKVNEAENAKSQVRIGQSSNVKAPDFK